ncbi:MAG: hypothetical protein FJX51_11565, partial [Alphaproteobacteria bacterium]|nr:hypothetical protein [Alphaproteobacteria bacterium]
RVTAIERSPARARTLAANMERVRLGAEIVVADALDWRPSALADAVLLDAPCGASGTLRRHPDAARVKDPADTAALTQTQCRLLDAALAMVKPGGCLVYAVCSLDPAEGADMVRDWLEAGAPARRAPIAAAELGGEAPFLDAQGDLRTLPCHWAARGGLDGFYAARLVRTA